jgi:pyridoxal phosphate enzyme (YggS family)
VSQVASRLAEVRARIDAAARRCGRDPASVQLIAVSKTHPAEALELAHQAGQRHFGESYAQELRDKGPALASLPELHWHYIGRIQSNKIRYIAPWAHRVHTLTRLDHARALARRAEGTVRCLVQVHTGDESTKGGVPPAEALDAARSLDEVPGIEIVGLMTLPPPVEHPDDAAPYFRQLAELAEQGRRQGLSLHELSMGMSSDYEVAIAHGATWVRVGTAIFGRRS